jgi:hypothetical protein
MFCGCRLLHTIIKGDQIMEDDVDYKNGILVGKLLRKKVLG